MATKAMACTELSSTMIDDADHDEHQDVGVDVM
jgi:hypothetical protein